MIFHPGSLRARILASFTHKNTWNVPTLMRELAKTSSCSTAGVYKELAALTKAGALIKSGELWHLSITWTLEIAQVGQRLYESASAYSGIVNSLEHAKSATQSWKFSDLRSMDAFWVQLMFVLFEHARERKLYEIVPRLWFPLADLALDERHERAMATKKNEINLLVVGSSKIENALVKKWAKSSYRVVLNGSHSFRPSAYLCAIDDWTIEVSVHRRIQEEIERFFEREKEISEAVYRKFRGILAQRTPSRILLSLNPRLAQRIRAEVEAALERSV